MTDDRRCSTADRERPARPTRCRPATRGDPAGRRRAAEPREPRHRGRRARCRRAAGDRGARRGLRRRSPAVRGAASSCARSAAAGGCTCARSTTTSSPSSCNTQAPSRLSQAALETLAVIAYKQPVTRGQVASIRAVNVDSVVRTLLGARPDHRGVHRCRDRRDPLRHDRRAAREPRHQLARRAAAHLAAARRRRRRLRRGAARMSDETWRRTGRDPVAPRACGCRRCSRTRASPRAGSPRTSSSRAGCGSTARSSPSSARASTPRSTSSTSTARPSSSTPTKRYVMLNKPRGVVSSMTDERGRPDLREFTEDWRGAALQRRATGCRHQRSARAHERRRARPRARAPLVRRHEGLHREGRGQGDRADDREAHARASSSRTARSRPTRRGCCRQLGATAASSLVELTLHSGRNRIVRRMMAAVGHPVVELVRRQFGPLHLGTLPVGPGTRVD